jgi:CspA family cold shock protein
MDGYIKSYSDKKGYGFIDNEQHGVIFFHKSGIRKLGYFGLQKGDAVTFELQETPKGKQAIKLQPLK